MVIGGDILVENIVVRIKREEIRGRKGCKSGEISKPGWELSSSGQHHGWRVELECFFPTLTT